MVHYQPVIDVASERISSVEALVRWTRDDFGTGDAALSEMLLRPQS